MLKTNGYESSAVDGTSGTSVSNPLPYPRGHWRRGGRKNVGAGGLEEGLEMFSSGPGMAAGTGTHLSVTPTRFAYNQVN